MAAYRATSEAERLRKTSSPCPVPQACRWLLRVNSRLQRGHVQGVVIGSPIVRVTEGYTIARADPISSLGGRACGACPS